MSIFAIPSIGAGVLGMSQDVINPEPEFDWSSDTLGGARTMNEIYEELGLSVPKGYANAWDYHNRPDKDNLAHKYNRKNNNLSKEKLRLMVMSSPDYVAHRKGTIDIHHDYWDGVAPTPWHDTEQDDADSLPDQYTLSNLHTFQLTVDVGNAGYEDFVEHTDKFISEMWGTPEFIHGGDDDDYWEHGEGGHVAAGTDRDWWGLDIKWSMKDEEGNDITKDDTRYYEYVTGKVWETEDEALANVNWEYYQDGEPQDNRWVKAHQDLGGDDKIDTFQEIRDANKLVYEKVLEEARAGEEFDPTKGWLGQYERKFDPDNAPQYEGAELDVFKNYTREPLRAPRAKTREAVGMPDSLQNLKTVNVKRPNNLPSHSWSI